jgi:plastocyanin
MFRRIAPALIVGALLFGLTACGGSSNTIAVTTTDFKFDAQSWTVSAGQEVTLTITNKGANEHEWVLLKMGTAVTPPFDADDEDKVFWEIEAQPGETKTETFTAPSEAGTYTIVCGISGHLEQGMQAALAVK